MHCGGGGSSSGGGDSSGAAGAAGRRIRRRRRIDGLLAALAVAGLMSVAATVPHELGHVAVCAAGGHDYRIMMGPMGPMVDCSAVPDPVWLYRAMGGAAGAVLPASLLAWGRLRGSEPWRAGLAAALYMQLAIMVIETAAHPLYMTSPAPTAAVAASSLLVMLSLTGRRLPGAGSPGGAAAPPRPGSRQRGGPSPRAPQPSNRPAPCGPRASQRATAATAEETPPSPQDARPGDGLPEMAGNGTEKASDPAHGDGDTPEVSGKE